MNNIIHDTFAGWIADGADDHFELFCKVKYNFVQMNSMISALLGKAMSALWYR